MDTGLYSLSDDRCPCFCFGGALDNQEFLRNNNNLDVESSVFMEEMEEMDCHLALINL